MYSAVKQWLKTPIKIYTGVKDGYSSYTYDRNNPSDALCYPVEEFKMVRNLEGKDVVSQIHLHVDGSVVIDKSGSNLIDYDGQEYKVQALERYRDTQGNVDIQVIHL